MEVKEAVKMFWNAADNNDDAAARKALESIPAEVVNKCDGDDYDMLITAVQNGDGCAVRALLASGKCDLAHRENLCGMTAEEFSLDYPEDAPVRRAFAEYRANERRALLEAGDGD